MNVFYKLLRLAIILLLPIGIFAQTILPESLDGEIYVKFKNEHSLNVSTDKHGNINFRRLDVLSDLVDKYDIQRVYKSFYFADCRNLLQTVRVEFGKTASVSDFIRELSAISVIEYAEPVPYLQKCLTPNDMGTNSVNNGTWGLYKINAQQAWDISTGDPNIVVAIVDDAVQTTHPDLAGNMLPGRDVALNTNDPNPPNTSYSHGTHVAGISGAVTNNGTGVASIGWSISILPVKATNNVNSISHGYEGVTWAANNGAHVINMSWGGAQSYQTAINVINAAYNNGCVLVAAAGNSGHEGNPIFYPAAYNSVIAVANTTSTDAKATSSQYGTWIDISAPGTNIRSTIPNNTYAIYTGTSMASPMVAGLASLMLSVNPNLTQADVKNCLQSSADNIDAQNPNFIGQIGAGRINAYQALLCVNASMNPLDAGISEIVAPAPTTCSNQIVPIVKLRNYGMDPLTSVTIRYRLDNGSLQTYNWTGNLTTNTTTNITLPSYTVTPGAHTFMAYTQNPNNGTDGNHNNDTASTNFFYFNTGFSLPFTEDFESGSLNTNYWNIHNPDNSITWEIATTGGTTPGNKSVKMNHYSYTATGQRNGLLTPPLNFNGYSSIELTFEHAYRRYDQSSSDSLIIYVSTNCGASFPHRVFARAENGQGIFATASTSTAEFTPAQPSDWCIDGTVGASCFTIDLSTFIGHQNVIIKFESYNNYQNNLYLDNINITGVESAIPPNPDFIASPGTVCEGGTVAFTDMSAPSATGWLWTFPGGIPSTSTDQNPSVVYNTPGVYGVTLEATNASGTGTITFPNYITVNALPPIPVITQNGSTLSTSVTGVTFQWYLNGSPIPNSTTSSITASVPGLYTVEVTNSGNCFSISLPFDFTGSNPYDAGVVQIIKPSNVSCSGTITPEVRIRNFGGQTLTSAIINYRVNGGQINTYNWSGSLNTNNEVNVVLPAISVSSGMHIFKAYTSMPNGNVDSNTSNDTTETNFYVYNIGMPLPFTEDFQSNSFATQNWTIVNPDNGITWELFQTNGTFPGNIAARMNFFNYTTTGERDGMISPPLNFSGYSSITLKFDHAYRRYNQTSSDSLIIYVSTDCGLTFPNRVFARGESGAGTFATSQTNTANFIPTDSSQWCMGTVGANCFSVDLSPFAGNPSVILKFESYNNYQNNLYIDNINISGVPLSAAPVADFIADYTNITAGGNVNFSDLSTNNPTSWSWTFTGGTPANSSVQNPTNIVYNSSGLYDVKLVVTNANGSDSITKTAYINVDAVPPPVADFTANVTTIMQGGSVNFTDLSTNNPSNWVWTFNGGTPATSTAQNPSNIVYNAPGTYNVKLVVSNIHGADSITKTAYITVNAVPPPIADFVANQTTIDAGQSINFIDMSTNNPANWTWTFTGGTPATSTAQNPINIAYNTPGSYDVKLVVSNAFGSDSITKTSYITVNVVPPPVADFTANLTSVYVGQGVNFTDLSTNNPNSWNWTFNGATPATSNLQNPSGVIWGTPGTYDVKLVVSNAFGSDSITKTSYITVEVVPMPVVDFTANQTTINAGLAVNFTDLTSNYPSGWSWTFSGGTPASSSAQNPTGIVYNNPGIYDVTLVATNASGSDSLTKTAYITVNIGSTVPVVDFEANTTTITQGNAINFTDLSTNNPTSWLWAFEGGTPSSSTAQNPSGIVYNNSGTYYVTLIATNASGTGFLNKETYITVNVGSSIDDMADAQLISIYPNPAQDIIYISLNLINEDYCNIYLYNLVGQKLVENYFNNLSTGKTVLEIDISTLPKGVYYIELETSERKTTHKAIVF